MEDENSAGLSTKRIADALRSVAYLFPDEVADDQSRVVVLRVGSFSLRCLPTKAAVLAISERYRKGRTPTTDGFKFMHPRPYRKY